MYSAYSKPIELFTASSIAKGNKWFKEHAYEYFGCNFTWKKTRINNCLDDVMLWVKGDYTRTMNISFKNLSLEEFDIEFQFHYWVIYTLLWRYSNVENSVDFVKELLNNGLVFKRQRNFESGENSKMMIHFGIFTVEEDKAGVSMVKKEGVKFPHLCYCGCGEYKIGMKKTRCCGRRYVNIAHQRSNAVNGKKCPCGLEEKEEEKDVPFPTHEDILKYVFKNN